MGDGHNPPYPKLNGPVSKYRRMARSAGGVMKMDPTLRRAYGAAVEQAILALQRREATTDLAPDNPLKCSCASGTFHSDGAAIHEAVRRQQRSALVNCPAATRRKRTAQEWETMYAEAMDGKGKVNY